MLFAPPDNMLPLKAVAGGVLLFVRVSPNAAKTKVGKIENRQDIIVLKIYIKEPAVSGNANKALVNFLSEYLSVSKSSIEIKKGLMQKDKTLFIQDIDMNSVIKKII